MSSNLWLFMTTQQPVSTARCACSDEFSKTIFGCSEHALTWITRSSMIFFPKAVDDVNSLLVLLLNLWKCAICNHLNHRKRQSKASCERPKLCFSEFACAITLNGWPWLLSRHDKPKVCWDISRKRFIATILMIETPEQSTFPSSKTFCLQNSLEQ